MNASDTNELTLAPCVDSIILQTWQPSIFTDNLSGMRDYFKIGRGSTFPRSLMFHSSPRAPKEIDYQSSPEEPKQTNRKRRCGSNLGAHWKETKSLMD